jgi:hypothetical protein
MIVKVWGDPDPVPVGVRKSQLQGAKQSSQSQDHGSHETEFAEHSLPFLDADSALVVQFLEDVEDPFSVMLSELKSATARVQHPA